ncbi:MAG UNVERIFIED_CONTAM: hypothetical protein LVR29_14300 [Microcystis novacekii LVE1205-3]
MAREHVEARDQGSLSGAEPPAQGGGGGASQEEVSGLAARNIRAARGTR